MRPMMSFRLALLAVLATDVGCRAQDVITEVITLREALGRLTFESSREAGWQMMYAKADGDDSDSSNTDDSYDSGDNFTNSSNLSTPMMQHIQAVSQLIVAPIALFVGQDVEQLLHVMNGLLIGGISSLMTKLGSIQKLDPMTVVDVFAMLTAAAGSIGATLQNPQMGSRIQGGVIFKQISSSLATTYYYKAMTSGVSGCAGISHEYTTTYPYGVPENCTVHVTIPYMDYTMEGQEVVNWVFTALEYGLVAIGAALAPYIAMVMCIFNAASLGAKMLLSSFSHVFVWLAIKAGWPKHQVMGCKVYLMGLATHGFFYIVGVGFLCQFILRLLRMKGNGQGPFKHIRFRATKARGGGSPWASISELRLYFHLSPVEIEDPYKEPPKEGEASWNMTFEKPVNVTKFCFMSGGKDSKPADDPVSFVVEVSSKEGDEPPPADDASWLAICEAEDAKVPKARNARSDFFLFHAPKEPEKEEGAAAADATGAGAAAAAVSAAVEGAEAEAKGMIAKIKRSAAKAKTKMLKLKSQASAVKDKVKEKASCVQSLIGKVKTAGKDLLKSFMVPFSLINHLVRELTDQTSGKDKKSKQQIIMESLHMVGWEEPVLRRVMKQTLNLLFGKFGVDSAMIQKIVDFVNEEELHDFATAATNQQFSDFVKDLEDVIRKMIEEEGGQLVEGAKAAVEEAKEAVKEEVKEAQDAAKEAVSEAKEAATKAVEKGKEGAASVEAMGGAVMSDVKEEVEDIMKMIKPLQDALDIALREFYMAKAAIVISNAFFTTSLQARMYLLTLQGISKPDGTEVLKGKFADLNSKYAGSTDIKGLNMWLERMASGHAYPGRTQQVAKMKKWFEEDKAHIQEFVKTDIGSYAGIPVGKLFVKAQPAIDLYPRVMKNYALLKTDPKGTAMRMVGPYKDKFIALVKKKVSSEVAAVESQAKDAASDAVKQAQGAAAGAAGAAASAAGGVDLEAQSAAKSLVPEAKHGAPPDESDTPYLAMPGGAAPDSSPKDDHHDKMAAMVEKEANKEMCIDNMSKKLGLTLEEAKRLTSSMSEEQRAHAAACGGVTLPEIQKLAERFGVHINHAKVEETQKLVQAHKMEKEFKRSAKPFERKAAAKKAHNMTPNDIAKRMSKPAAERPPDPPDMTDIIKGLKKEIEKNEKLIEKQRKEQARLKGEIEEVKGRPPPAPPTLKWGRTVLAPKIELSDDDKTIKDVADNPKTGDDDLGRYRVARCDQEFSAAKNPGVHMWRVKFNTLTRLLCGICTGAVKSDNRESNKNGLHQIDKAWTVCVGTDGNPKQQWHAGKPSETGLPMMKAGSTLDIRLDLQAGEVAFAVDGQGAEGAKYKLPDGETFYAAVAIGGDDTKGCSLTFDGYKYEKA